MSTFPFAVNRGLLSRRLLTPLLATLILWGALSPAYSQQPRNILSAALARNHLDRVLVSASAWHPYPRAKERQAWQTVVPSVRDAYLKQAEVLRGCSWETPRATLFLGFVRTGDRKRYQDVSFGRRQQLATLVLGECCEGKGRFLDDIVDGIWTICEETYWGVPAHVGAQKRGVGLPDVSEPTVDLFAAETATLLTWTSYLLRDTLDVVSPLVCDRIDYEVQRRILGPNLDRNDFWWMGFNRQVNNWNPWICSNWLTAALLLEKEPQRRIAAVDKIMRCLDNFLNGYTDDGGCDEGPTYWGRAGGSLFDCLELLESATGGSIDVYGEPLIRAIGTYITRAYIHGEYFVNFADAAAKHRADAATIFRYGKALDDAVMTSFGAYLADVQGIGSGTLPGQFGVLGRVLPAIFSLPALRNTRSGEPLGRDSWLPGLQVMMARSVGGSTRGLYLAAQGGHNAESHNHNDVGNFVVYADGEPVIIDVGVETYTAKTFSKERYSIWTMQSAYHNLPTINGVMQKEGREFRAADVRYEATDSLARVSMDIAPAYPESAAVRRWHRTTTLLRGSRVTIRDEYALRQRTGDVRLFIMTCRKPEVRPDGTVLLEGMPGADRSRPVVLSYDTGKLAARVEPIEISDSQLKSSWGDRIFRIVLVAIRPVLADTLEIEIQ